MANQITGHLIAVSDIEMVPSTQHGKEPMARRKVFMDCTRYDPYTGERGFENTPLLEFGGKVLDKLNQMVQNGLKKGDIIRITFDIQGTKYTNKTTGKTDVFTRVRPYDIELYTPNASQAPQGANMPQGGMQQANLTQAAPEAPQTAQQPSGGNGGRKQEDDLPF